MTDDKAQTPEKIYAKIVAEFPDFEVGNPKLLKLGTDDPVMRICWAGPDVFDYWLAKMPYHAAELKDLYEAASRSQFQIAKNGAAVWNYWQREQSPQIEGPLLMNVGGKNFSGFHFLQEVVFSTGGASGEVNFSGTTFSGRSDFTGVSFSDKVDFSEAIFSKEVSFKTVIFSGAADFSSAMFSHEANFEETKFRDIADFSKVKFSSEVSFLRGEFSGKADFRKVEFLGEADFREVRFPDGSSFEKVTFSSEVNFSGGAFSSAINFTGVKFSGKANFAGMEFSGKANFKGVVFAGEANFTDVIFSCPANFAGVQFSCEAKFNSVKFSNEALFKKVKFANLAYFGEGIFCGGTLFTEGEFAGVAEFTSVKFASYVDFTGVTFSLSSTFEKARFGSDSSFQDAKFKSRTVFTSCVFDKEPPRFHNAEIHQDTSFWKARWPGVKDKSKKGLLEKWRCLYHTLKLMISQYKSVRNGRAIRLEERRRSYRTLKLIFAQFQSVREEQEFGRLEMQAETHCMYYLGTWDKAVFLIFYGMFDYGYSAKRPGFWLLGLSAVGVLLALWGMDCSWNDSVRLSLSYTLPPFNLLAKTADTGYWFLWFEFQRLLSYLCWFLIGLAWRNQAKSK